MSKTSESGSIKNVAHFEQLHFICEGFGPPYAPTNPNLQLPQLEARVIAAKAVMQTVVDATTVYNIAVNARSIAFENLGKLSTRLLNALIACSASKQTIDDARGFNRKLHGARAGKRSKASESPTQPTTNANPQTDATVPTEKHISSSQSSHDQKIEHFARLVSLLAAEPNYHPNEADLKIGALSALLSAMRDANTAVFRAYSAIATARTARNKALYLGDSNLVDTALEVKAYVKSIFGSNSPEFKLVRHIPFKKEHL